jgi:hypothetical protein
MSEHGRRRAEVGELLRLPHLDLEQIELRGQLGEPILDR